MSIFRSIATGYLGAKIANTQANDELKARVLESASTNFYNNILPDAIANEKLRRSNYESIAAMNPNLAELADINGFTASKEGMERFDQFREENKLKSPDALKNLRFETDYNTRYNTRVKGFEEKYNPILDQIGIKELGGLGFNTMESLVGGKEPGPMKSQDMAKGPAPSDSFASTKLSDYFVTSPISYDIPEGEFQKVASTMREFGQFFTQDKITGELKVNLNETNRNEYGALRNITQEIAQNYLDQDGKVNVSAAMTAGSNILTEQTTNVIYGRQRADGFEQGIAAADGSDFSQNFNNTYKTDKAKKEYLAQGLFNLDGGQEAQRYFAQSFPETVLFDDNTSVRDYLLKLTGLKR
tara:strand:+ start:811 stop:1878 length:1068 start_codon:yes stop_codon:yes gene_type:complete